MNFALKVTITLHKAIKDGHFAIFTTHDIALATEESVNDNFRKKLSKGVSNRWLLKVCRDMYALPGNEPIKVGVLEYIASRLHWNKFIYVSLETELSRQGIISQIPFGYLTVMTQGRSGKIETRYGTIEFTHTSRKNLTEEDVYYDSDARIFRAKAKRAIADLKRVGRNTDMINEEVIND
ncbi:hypothetical protein HHX48_00075 [Salinimonas sp. HHU 13199]|uniref:Uncharacterized protein n=1 Tax=Salinimonas profundi TaxID=2729140 RepID=A0ABR8LFQ4_9ALTE|nr:hypothetical protein [Salinimonas profundi]MBD3584130.1 hypothetical protein [Salinimonas profundi]